MPYGEILSETKTYSNPYKFNGKELDTETGLAYYGARYYAPELGVWYGCDPLMEKYPAFSPYVFCAGNPVKLVDPDGRKVWDNKNIRDAERYAKKVGGTIKRWIGRNGYEHASVTKLYSSINSDGGYDVTVSTKAFLGKKSNQHNVLYNTAESLLGTSNSLDGKADPANLGTCTKQDVMVASGVIGTIIGGVSILAEGMSIMTGMAFLNSIDDVGTNIKGESISQQVVKKEKGKKIVGKIKTGINLLSIIGSSTTIHRTNDVVEKTIETTNIINTTTNEYINNKKNE
jgi:RHS repeat-associated protein